MAIVTEIRFNNMPKLAGLARQRAAEAVQVAANNIEGHAKKVVPVETGNLKGSIQAQPVSALTWEVGSRDVEYAAHVEYGTHHKTYHIPAQPYMRPAAELVRPAFIKAMKQIAEM